MSEANNVVPQNVFFTKGIGRHQEKLASFELALRSARIERYNLVKVSSILPPDCKITSRKECREYLKPGQILHCVLSENASNEPNRMIAASIGVAIPKDKGQYGYLSEHHSFGQSEKAAGDYAEDLAACMLATTLGIEFDVDKNYDERKEVWKMSNEIVKTRNITQSARVDKRGLWTTVIATAVFVI